MADGERKLKVIIQGDDESGPATESAADGMGKIGAAATAMAATVATAAAAAGAALVAGLYGAVEREASVDKLAARLGLNEQQAERLGSAAGQVYADAYGSSLDEVTLAVETVYSSIEGMADASAGEIRGVTEMALDFASAFDIDVSRAATSAGIAIRSGLVDDAREAFDLMVAAAQNTSPLLREAVLDAADEYGQFFVMLGIDGPQAFGMLSAAAGSGEQVLDKVGDALKEFGIIMTTADPAAYADRFSAMGLDFAALQGQFAIGGDAAGAAFDQIVSGLQSMGDPLAQQQAAIALFGTPLEDLGAHQIPQFLSALSSGDTALGDFEGAASEMGATLSGNTITSLTQLGRTVETAIVDKLNAALPAVNSVIAAVQSFSDRVEAEAGPAVSTFAENLRSAVSEMELAQPKMGPVADGLTALGDTMVAAGDKIRPVVEDIAGKIWDKWAQIQPKVQGYLDAVTSAVGSAMELLAIVIGFGVDSAVYLWDTFGDDVWNIVSPMVDMVIGLFTGLFEVLGGILDFFVGLFTGDWDRMFSGAIKTLTGFGTISTALFDGIRGVVAGVGGLISTLWTTAWTRMGDGVRMAKDYISQTVSNLMTVVPVLVRVGADMAYSYLSGAFSRMIGAVSSAAGGVIGQARHMVDSVVSTITGIGTRAYNAGYEIVDRVADGIRAAVSRVRSAISSVTSAISRHLPGSPVREGPLRVVNRGVAGSKIVDMIADGIDGERSTLTASLDSVMSPPVPGVGGQTSTSGAATSGGVGDSYHFDLRGAVVPDSAAFEDLILRALDRAGRTSPGRLSVAGRPL